MQRILTFFLYALAILLAAALLFGFGGSLHPAFDAIAHFRAHLAVLATVLALVLIWVTTWRAGAPLLLLALVAFLTTFDAVSLSGALQQQATPAPRYSLVQINLRFDNRRQKPILDMIAREKPDIITYQEGGKYWLSALRILEKTYAYRLHCPRGAGVMEVGILSRYPIREDARHACVGDGLLAIAPVDLGGVVVAIASLHLEWPWPYAQDQHVRQITPTLQHVHGPLIIGGDFNATPWSHTVRQVETASGARHMGGLGPSWLTRHLPAAWLSFVGLPIDQVLVSRDILAPRASTLGNAGSDHLPVRLDFSVPATPR